MAAELGKLIDHRVVVLTNEGRTIVGDLAGLDQSINLILRDSVERVWSSDKGMELVPSGGLSMLRGDSVAAVCELNADADAAMDWEAVKADAIPRLKP